MKIHTILGVLGFISMVVGIILATMFHYVPWYGFFVGGGAFFLMWINYILGATNFVSRIQKNYKKELLIFLLYLIPAITIELCGKNVFGFWIYPDLSLGSGTFIYVIFTYLFAFYMLYECYTLLGRLLRSKPLAFIVTFLGNGFVHEYLNTRTYEWLYQFTEKPPGILGIHLIILLGWSVFLVVPLVAHSIVYKVRLGFDVKK